MSQAMEDEGQTVYVLLSGSDPQAGLFVEAAYTDKESAERDMAEQNALARRSSEHWHEVEMEEYVLNRPSAYLQEARRDREERAARPRWKPENGRTPGALIIDRGSDSTIDRA